MLNILHYNRMFLYTEACLFEVKYTMGYCALPTIGIETRPPALQVRRHAAVPLGNIYTEEAAILLVMCMYVCLNSIHSDNGIVLPKIFYARGI